MTKEQLLKKLEGVKSDAEIKIAIWNVETNLVKDTAEINDIVVSLKEDNPIYIIGDSDKGK